LNIANSFHGISFLPGLIIVLFWVLFSSVGSVNAEETSFFPVDIRYLNEEDIKDLSAVLTDKQLIARFGPSKNGDAPMLFWPKAALKGQAADITLWKKGYWFFFKRQENGRLLKPHALQYVASYPANETTENKSLMELLPEMVIDWPLEMKGKRLFGVY